MAVGAEVSVPTVAVGVGTKIRSGNALTTKLGGDYFETSLRQFGLGSMRAKVGLMMAMDVEFGGYMSLGSLCLCK